MTLPEKAYIIKGKVNLDVVDLRWNGNLAQVTYANSERNSYSYKRTDIVELKLKERYNAKETLVKRRDTSDGSDPYHPSAIGLYETTSSKKGFIVSKGRNISFIARADIRVYKKEKSYTTEFFLEIKKKNEELSIISPEIVSSLDVYSSESSSVPLYRCAYQGSNNDFSPEDVFLLENFKDDNKVIAISEKDGKIVYDEDSEWFYSESTKRYVVRRKNKKFPSTPNEYLPYVVQDQLPAVFLFNANKGLKSFKAISPLLSKNGRKAKYYLGTNAEDKQYVYSAQEWTPCVEECFTITDDHAVVAPYEEGTGRMAVKQDVCSIQAYRSLSGELLSIKSIKQDGRSYNEDPRKFFVIKKNRIIEPPYQAVKIDGEGIGRVDSITKYEDVFDKNNQFYLVERPSKFKAAYRQNDLQITSPSNEQNAHDVLEYLKAIAGLSKISINGKEGPEGDCKENEDAEFDSDEIRDLQDDGVSITEEINVKKQISLRDKYEGLFVGEGSLMEAYLENSINKHQATKCDSLVVIFPFGSNGSQIRAVKAAINNRISIIQGPPGTGKTQTILNVIANLIIRGQSAEVVSNNNSAVENVIEKLQKDRYGMGFFVAKLGKSKNKKDFINSQTGKYPQYLESWKQTEEDMKNLSDKIGRTTKTLERLYEKDVELKRLVTRINEAEHERLRFNEAFPQAASFINETTIKHIDSYKKIVLLKTRVSLVDNKALRVVDALLLKLGVIKKRLLTRGLVNRSIIRVTDWSMRVMRQLREHFVTYEEKHISRILDSYGIQEENATLAIDYLMHDLFCKELAEERVSIEKELKEYDFEQVRKELEEDSLTFFKGVLFQRYGNKDSRTQFTLYKDTDNADRKIIRYNSAAFLKEYPIVLSTTFSAVSNISPEVKFDYLIMDEASQVDVSAGALALSVAKNAVVVGDEKQLPNVVTKELKDNANPIIDAHQMKDTPYDFLTHSFLSSIQEVFKDAPNTELLEHYRCHPLIIQFCNKMFYSDRLVVMTKGNFSDDAMEVIIPNGQNAVEGNVNQKQIDEIKANIDQWVIKNRIRKGSSEAVGIIAPYRKQVEAMQRESRQTSSPLFGVDIDTVHKFQGRAEELVIFSSVDKKIKPFTDDPHLLNVAVSRAVKKFVLILSDGDPEDGNVRELRDYIARYDPKSIKKGTVTSVFDMLYSEYTKQREEFLRTHVKISNELSENLYYSVILDVLHNNNLENAIHVQNQYPMLYLTKQYEGVVLTEDERQYANKSWTHVDFLLSNTTSSKPLLVIEIDGLAFHRAHSDQENRDRMKDSILNKIGIPIMRVKTNESFLESKLEGKLKEINVIESLLSTKSCGRLL